MADKRDVRSALRAYEQPSMLQGAWDEISGAFARYGRRSGAQRDASLAMLNQASAPGTDPFLGAGQKVMGLAGLLTHPLAFFPTGDEWRERLSNAGNTGRMGQAIGGMLGDLPSIVDPHLLAGGGALAAAPILGKMVNKVDDVADAGRASAMGDKLSDLDEALLPLDSENIPEISSTIERVANAAGLRVKRGMSEKSDSEYITLSRADDPDGVFDEVKIRISDHELPSYYAESTYDVGPHGAGIPGGWLGALDEAFADLGLEPLTLKSTRDSFFKDMPDWKRQVFEKQFSSARARGVEAAKKKGQSADGGFLSDLPSLIDPQMAAGGAALAAAPLLGKIAGKVDDVADVGKASAMGEDGITAYHGTFSEPFDAPDFQKLGTFTKKNTQDDWVEGEKAYNLANLGFWSHQTPLEDTYKGGNILKVKVGGQGEHFNSLDELNGAINESGGVDAFRRKLTRQGYGHVSVADDEFGGGMSYVSLFPETAQIVKDE